MLLFHLPALLSLLLAASRPGEPLKPLDLYGTEEAAFFSRHRVREIVVLEQGYYKGQLGGPRWARAVQQLDRRGRVIKQWKYPNQGRFSALEESTYDAAGHLTDRTTSRNESPATDTSRLGTSWRPELRVHYPVAPGQAGYGEQWNFRANRWQRTEATRRWSSHDTTYVQTTRLPDTVSGFLLRTYPAPGGRTRRQRNDRQVVHEQYAIRAAAHVHPAGKRPPGGVWPAAVRGRPPGLSAAASAGG